MLIGEALNSQQKYLVGDYEVEILTLPRYVQTVHVDQVKTTTITIPPPGKATFHASSPGYGSIFQQDGNELIWVTDIDPEQKRFGLDLQPGQYTIIFRPKSAQNTLYSVSQNFSISSGSSVIVKLK